MLEVDVNEEHNAAPFTEISMKQVSGYLFKHSESRPHGDAWKDRFFILCGNVLSCFINHRNLDGKRGELLLFHETKAELDEFDGKQFGIKLSGPFDAIHLAAANAADQKLWLAALNRAIDGAKKSLRGYMLRISASGSKKEKFFVLHENSLSYHSGSDNLNVQGFVVFQPGVTVRGNEKLQLLQVRDNANNNVINLEFVQPKPGEQLDISKYGEYYIWRSRIEERVNESLQSAYMMSPFFRASTNASSNEDKPAVNGEHFSSSHISTVNNIWKEGELAMKPSRDDVDVVKWRKCMFRLQNSEMVAIPISNITAQNHLSIRNLDNTNNVTFHIAPNSGVFETNLGEFTFELVATNKILHVSAASRQSQLSWIAAIKRAIVNSILDFTDPLFLHALLHIDNDEYYKVHFDEKCSLGVIFERAGEWAIVKSSSQEEHTKISVGSVLASVNDKSVSLSSFRKAIGMLRNWQPPLTMTFRRVPRKEGYLLKWCRDAKDDNKRSWKKKYFILDGGCLSYKDRESDQKLKQSLLLIGSSVSLISNEKFTPFTHQHSGPPSPTTADKTATCFRFLSSVTSISMQGTNRKQALEWASYLYHAIAIANGGTYVLEYEKDRVQAAKDELAGAELAADSHSGIASSESVDVVAETIPIPVPADHPPLGEELDGTSNIDHEHEHTLEHEDHQDHMSVESSGEKSAESDVDHDINMNVSVFQTTRSNTLDEEEMRDNALDLLSPTTEPRVLRRKQSLLQLQQANASRSRVAISEALSSIEQEGYEQEAEEDIAVSRTLLDSLKKEEARSQLASALDAVNEVSSRITVDKLSEAIAVAKAESVTDLFYSVAKLELFVQESLLFLSTGSQPPFPIDWSNAIETSLLAQSPNIAEQDMLRQLHEGLDGKASQEVTKNLAVVQKNCAERFLAECIKSSTSGDFELLVIAIHYASSKDCNSFLVERAEAQLVSFQSEGQSVESLEKLLRSSMEAINPKRMEYPLKKLRALGLKTSPLVVEAEHFLEELEKEENRSVIITQLADAVRLRAKETIQRALLAAEKFQIHGELVDIAREVLAKVLAKEQGGSENIRGRISSATSVAMTTYAPTIQRRKSVILQTGIFPKSTSITGAINTTAITQDAPWTRKDFHLAKSTAQEFAKEKSPSELDISAIDLESAQAEDLISVQCDDGATVGDVVKVYRKYSVKFGSINAMQFSSIWRLLTKEKGNLYREMQMFKLFDTENCGAISESEFVTGWKSVSKLKEGKVILRRLKELAGTI